MGCMDEIMWVYIWQKREDIELRKRAREISCTEAVGNDKPLPMPFDRQTTIYIYDDGGLSSRSSPPHPYLYRLLVRGGINSCKI